MKIEAVVLFSSNDKRFFKPCISNLLEAGINVKVVTYSHMWAGTEEDQQTLAECNKLYEANSNYQQYMLQWEPGQSSWYWEGLGRYLATQEVADDTDFIIYIDVDEIIDPKKFNSWLKSTNILQYDVLKLANYWYWREPIYRADQVEDSVVVCKAPLAKSVPMKPGGRENYFNSSNNSIRLGHSDPFIHHYSWVRTKEEMLNKVRNWGHKDDHQDWQAKVEEEFSREFNGTDFIHRYKYNIVNSFIK
jgi:hypothetical protein